MTTGRYPVPLVNGSMIPGTTRETIEAGEGFGVEVLKGGKDSQSSRTIRGTEETKRDSNYLSGPV